VKTAISLPDETFDRATRRAAELGISRSEFFATAAQRYLDELDTRSLTAQVDAALEAQHSPDDSSVDAVAAGHRRLAADDDW
jgi:metal-responsive CopG/Arc/MetJ family transcriptional regulator